jgi:Mg-chelatase subunit ChlD
LGSEAIRLNSQSPKSKESIITLIDKKSINQNELNRLLELNNIEYIKQIRSLYFFLDRKKNISLNKSLRDSRKSTFSFKNDNYIKNLINYILSLVRNKHYEESVNVFQKKKNRISFHQNKESDNQFTIDPKELNKYRIKLSKRKKTKFIRKNSNIHSEKGRIIRYTNNKEFDLSLIKTIINSIYSGHYVLANKRFDITKSDFLYPQYTRNEIYNIMLVLDTSNSISWVVPHIEKFISVLTSNVSNSRDKLGLITFNNDLAKIYHYPTLNTQLVIGSINNLKVKGQTPLGDGLNLAREVFQKDQYNLPGMENIILLITDGYPEPLEGGHKNLMDEPSYKLVLSASKKIKEDRIKMIIINPAIDKNHYDGWGEKLIKKIVAITDAKLIEITPKYKFNLIKGSKAFVDESYYEMFSKILNETKINI